jgi:hypothetical protein
MIVKILGNKGGGSAGAVIDYMLGKDKDRDGAILLSGDPDLTARLADNLDFQNRYTVGVLSFEEPNLKDHIKQEIMQDFEKTLLAGLERDQYDITWIEHTDKGRLELNFIIPNVELRMMPSTDSGRLINIHCLFNPEFLDSIENDFFGSINHNLDFLKYFYLLLIMQMVLINHHHLIYKYNYIYIVDIHILIFLI